MHPFAQIRKNAPAFLLPLALLSAFPGGPALCAGKPTIRDTRDDAYRQSIEAQRFMEGQRREQEQRGEEFLRELDDKKKKEAWAKEKEENRRKSVLEGKKQFVNRTGGYFRTNVGELWGYNKSGRRAIEAQFDDCFEFEGEFARVKTGGKWGFVDRAGKMAVPATYDYVWDPGPDRKAKVREGETTRYIDMPAPSELPTREETLQERKTARKKNSRAVGARGGPALVTFKSGELMGYATPGGQTVIPARFEDCWSFKENLARAKSGGKWGFIDTTGEWAIPATFDYAWDFQDGKAKVREGDITRKIDTGGKPADGG